MIPSQPVPSQLYVRQHAILRLNGYIHVATLITVPTYLKGSVPYPCHSLYM